jgi:hypothetical protein
VARVMAVGLILLLVAVAQRGRALGRTKAEAGEHPSTPAGVT